MMGKVGLVIVSIITTVSIITIVSIIRTTVSMIVVNTNNKVRDNMDKNIQLVQYSTTTKKYNAVLRHIYIV